MPFLGDDAVIDFGGCFEGVATRRELFITNDSEFDVTVKMTASLKEQVVIAFAFKHRWSF